MQSLTVYSSPKPKVRIGNKYDGGYVVVDQIGEYDLLLSGGISNDISFEVDMLTRHPLLQGIAFDGTIADIPPHSFGDRLEFVKKNIGFQETESITNLHSYLNSHSNIFMKMDIEGGEYPFLSSVSDEQLTHIKQLVIEFHNPKQLSIPARLAKTHWLVHIHVNSVSQGRGEFIEGSFVPLVYECTYVRKDVFNQQLILNSDPIPNPLLDNTNIVQYPEISLNMWPYTTYRSNMKYVYRKTKLWGL